MIEAKLSGAFRRERLFYHVRGLAHLFAWVAGIVAVDLLLDWALDLPGEVRLGLLGLNVVLLGWLGYQYWAKYLRGYDAVRVALQVETLHPGVNSSVVSYVQLGAKSAHGSPSLIRAAREQTHDAVGGLDFSGIVDFRNLRRLLAISAGVLALFAVSCVFFGEYYLVLLQRMAMPFAEITYPTRTRIGEPTGHAAVKQGDPIEIVVPVSGDVPPDGRVVFRIGDNARESAEIARGPDSTFTFRLPKATQSVTYQFRIGDARSPERSVKVVPPPRIVTATASVRYPKYTDLQPATMKLSEMRAVPEGSAVTWDVKCDQSIVRGKMIFGGDQPRELKFAPDSADHTQIRVQETDIDKVVPPSADRQLVAAVPYHFEWTVAEAGQQFTFVDPTRYVLEVIPDKAPVVTVYKPLLRGESDKALATKNLVQEFEYYFADDYGPGTAKIVYRVNGSAEAAVPFGKVPKLNPDQVAGMKWNLAKFYPNLKEGDVVTFQLEVTDNRETKAGPNATRSPSYKVHVVDDKEYRAYIDRQVTLGLERTSSTAQDVLQSSKKLKTIYLESPK